MGKADLHIHSDWSDGMASVPSLMQYAETHTDLDVVAIADHDQVAGALEAMEWCAGRPAGRLQALVATEISAAWGRHVLALFPREPYPTQPFGRFRSLARTVATVRDAGGVVAIPHPLSPLVPSVGQRILAQLLAAPEARRGVQAVEICSGVLGGRRAEPALRRLNDGAWHLAALGCSDAHHLIQIGSAFTSFPGTTREDLARAIAARTTEACWGVGANVSLKAHLSQNWRSLVIKPLRELRALRSAGLFGRR